MNFDKLNEFHARLGAFGRAMNFLNDLDADPKHCHGAYEAPLLQAAVSTTYKTAGALWVSATTRRLRLYEVELGQMGAYASTDAPVQWDLSRFSATAILTATSVTPNLLDPADVACSAVFANNAATELTYTTAGNGLALKNWGLNQRGSYRWGALDPRQEIVIPASAQAGIGVRAQSITSGYTGSAVGNLSFYE